MMKFIEKKIVKENPGGTVGSMTTQVGEFPTYKDGCLEVTFYRISSNSVEFPMAMESKYCPPGAPCMPPRYWQRVVTFGVEEYVQYEKCKGGKLKKKSTDRAKYVKEYQRTGPA